LQLPPNAWNRGRPCAGSGRALPCTRNFFEKKLSKSFLPAAAGEWVRSHPLLPAAPPAVLLAGGVM